MVGEESQTSSFLALPSEIRAEIFDLILGDETPDSSTFPPGLDSEPQVIIYGTVTSSSLLCTCQQVRVETLAAIARFQSHQQLRRRGVLCLKDEQRLHLVWTLVPVMSSYVDRIDIDLLIRGAPPSTRSGFASDGLAPPPLLFRIWSLLTCLPRARVLNIRIPNLTATDLPDGLELLPFEEFEALVTRSRRGVIHPRTVASEISTYTGSVFDARNYRPGDMSSADIPKRIGRCILNKFDNLNISTDDGFLSEWDSLPARIAVENMRKEDVLCHYLTRSPSPP